ncbi:MAG: ribbon-helix-helix protein, CopG family [Gammaproteobacteria bacterium]|nr:anti-toxin [Gemmatimonadota bacterium]MXW45260.1 ribbon-helix-helix protein, CopG family [Gammaproteobacteria bacterium]MYD01176.1 ribbon-helix-helix protein, CopG family [Gammaproteobacteria bacterium]MYI24924.1 ribbon-helix-helix protein, CopG family [Gammaproteobacteria bacterium]
MLAVRLPEDIEERIAELASRTGRTKTYYVKEAIMGQIDELEDKYLALDRLENPAKRWSLEDMEQGRDMES